MRYMLLIYTREADWAAMSEAEKRKISQDYGSFTEGIRQSGHFVTGDPLQPTPQARTVRLRSGKPVHTDGPFAETREQLGGYYVIEAKDLDEASRIAGRVPGARVGSIEVRPIQAM